VKLDLNSAYIVVIGATAREVVGEKSTTDTFSSVRVDDLVADPQGLEDHCGVQSSRASTDDTNRQVGRGGWVVEDPLHIRELVIRNLLVSFMVL